MGTPDNVIGNSILYFRIYFMGSIAVVLYNVGASILQSVGDSRSPMFYLIAASLLNVVLDLVFIAGFGMGVGSAAFATILSQALSAFLAFRKLGRARGAWAVRWRDVRFDLPTLRAVVAQGVPSGVQNSVISLANVVVQANINSFGADAMAGCAAYSKVEGFAFLPVTCFAMALATFVSQNIGAGQLGRGAQRDAVRDCDLRRAGRRDRGCDFCPGAAVDRRVQRGKRRSSPSGCGRRARPRCFTACWPSATAAPASCAAWAARWFRWRLCWPFGVRCALPISRSRCALSRSFR